MIHQYTTADIHEAGRKFARNILGPTVKFCCKIRSQMHDDIVFEYEWLREDEIPELYIHLTVDDHLKCTEFLGIDWPRFLKENEAYE